MALWPTKSCYRSSVGRSVGGPDVYLLLHVFPSVRRPREGCCKWEEEGRENHNVWLDGFVVLPCSRPARVACVLMHASCDLIFIISSAGWIGTAAARCQPRAQRRRRLRRTGTVKMRYSWDVVAIGSGVEWNSRFQCTTVRNVSMY